MYAPPPPERQACDPLALKLQNRKALPRARGMLSSSRLRPSLLAALERAADGAAATPVSGRTAMAHTWGFVVFGSPFGAIAVLLGL